MSNVTLSTLVRCCDKLLRPDRFRDWEQACNGLQVENRGTVRKLAAMVDATPATVRMAAAAGADLVIAHHGLFWSPSHPWTGKRLELLRTLLDHDMAVYSSHLPLDAHPTLGNNACLCHALGFSRLKPFFFDREAWLGFQTLTRIDRDALADRIARATGDSPRLLAGGPKTCRRIGVVSGGAGNDMRKAAADGVDTFITGEGSHWTHALAEELGLNVFYAGHYATETFGVKALAGHLSKRFSLDWTFVDHPSGL